jgi:hypothetical protein
MRFESSRLRAVAAALLSAAAFGAAALLVDAPRARGEGAPFSPTEEGEILQALVTFQRLYQDLFATAGGTAMLDDFPATLEAKHLVFTDLGFLREAGLVQVQDLAGATLVDTRRTGPETAEAIVYEEWNYVFRRIADRSVASDLKGMGQGFRYTLRRAGGRWLVAGWEPEDMAAPAAETGFKW